MRLKTPPLDQNVSDSPLTEGKEILRLESEALMILSENLNDSFNQAIHLIEGISGRLIIVGIGKSGHVARKIAATLTSTGQPSYFIHPTEASHGDLGMITKNDGILALSFSGETQEFHPLLSYVKRFDIPLIAMTRNKKSALATNATVTLDLPNIKEACPMGLAPTTSTTMMIALGDALAISLLKRRGFSEYDFGLFHPGGALGQKLLKVKDKMHHHDEIPLCSKKTLMKDVLNIITSKKFGCVGVIDTNGDLCGIVTDGDLRRCLQKGHSILEKVAEDMMKKNPITISSTMIMAEALYILQQKSITTLFVTDNKKPVGIIHIHDFLKSGIM